MQISKSKAGLFALAATIALGAGGGSNAAQLIVDGSFEAPNIGTGNYAYPGTPHGAVSLPASTQGAWTYGWSAIVNATGSNAWYGGAAPTGFDGAQFVALQSQGTVSQSFTANASTLYLNWLEGARPYMGDQSYQVQLGDTVVGSGFTTQSGDQFGLQSLTLTGLIVGETYDLTFKGLMSSDQTAFLDKVSLSDIAPPAPPPALVKTLFADDTPLPAGQSMIADFDNPVAAGFVFSGGWVRSGSQGLDSGMSAPPPGTTSDYLTLLNGQSAMLEATSGLLSQLSFFMGSPDTFNTVQFLGPNGYSKVLNGYDIWLPAAGGGTGDQGWGRRISYDFGGAYVNKVVFSSSGNSFELDNIAGILSPTAAVPEPATWALMIGGFGLMGAHLRRRRQALVRS